MPPKEWSRVLLLQGPVGPFFRELRKHLDLAGFDAWRVSFNAGDRLFAALEKRIDFSGDATEWEDWLRAFLDGAEFDYIVLFGSSRPAHAVARRVAAELDISVLSLEEGYIRPGFVTVEANGNNADSPLAGCLPPAAFEADPFEPAKQTFSSFSAMCWQGAAYYSVRTLLSAPRERALFHRRFAAIPEPFLWARNAWRRLTGRLGDFRTIERLLEHHDGRYFLVPLQVAADGQMGAAAHGWTAQRLIAEALASFARSGPEDCRLVFKIHPLERGHTDARRLVGQTAEALGIGTRVDVIDTGSLGLLTRHAAGMITINSTSGLSAIFHGVPLMVIGDALYAHRKLATCARGEPDFDSFWMGGFVAEEEVRQRYLAWIRHEALVPGDFYAADGIPLACEGVVRKLRNAAASSCVANPRSARQA